MGSHIRYQMTSSASKTTLQWQCSHPYLHCKPSGKSGPSISLLSIRYYSSSRNPLSFIAGQLQCSFGWTSSMCHQTSTNDTDHISTIGLSWAKDSPRYIFLHSLPVAACIKFTEQPGALLPTLTLTNLHRILWTVSKYLMVPSLKDKSFSQTFVNTATSLFKFICLQQSITVV